MDFHGISIPHAATRSGAERIEATAANSSSCGTAEESCVKTFSGGMKRRLEIARGLLHHPKIIFLDEPTLGLDPQTRNHMWNYLSDLNKNEDTTVFFTTHYMEEAERVAQRIAIIDHGKIVASGTVTTSIKQRTETESLEEAFLKLTGHDIREEEGTQARPVCALSARATGRRRR